MLRAFLLYLSQSTRIQRWVTSWSLSRRVSGRFIAGDTLAEAMEAIEDLRRRGLLATLDHLGENVADRADVERATQDYLRLVDEIERLGLPAGISIKLTQLGLELDYERCLANVLTIMRRASVHGIFVRIDMEHSAVVDKTLDTYRDLIELGVDNCGVVLQSYLYRSRQDAESLLATGAPIRLVKGAYDEPTEVAFPNKKDTDAEFDEIARLMIDRALELGGASVSEDGRHPPMVALGTHDEARIAAACDYAESVGLPKDAVEVQLLFGIRIDLGRQLAAQGYPLRVYVPYGTEWFPYFMRRLAERPANLWFFLTNLLRIR